MKRLSPAIATFIFSVVSCLAIAQTGQTITFTPEARLPQSPVYISQILVDGQPVSKNLPTNVSGDWSQHLTVVVTNASPKVIVEGVAKIMFLESGKGTQDSPVIGSDVFVGVLPPAARFKSDGTAFSLPLSLAQNPPISIGPGQSLTIDFSSVAHQSLLQATEQGGPITKVFLGLGAFYFSDGSRWASGLFSVPGDSAGQWKHIAASDFYLMPQPNGNGK